MTATTIRVQMAQRKDTAANWTAANPILLSGEIGYETDTKKFKIGDGTTNWNSLAYLPIPDGSGNLTITGNLEIGSTGSLTFEGSTADGFETTLAVTNPTADRTITMPNQSGVVLVSGNASIVDADIAANAEIAVSKLADGTARQLLQTDAAGTGVEWTSNVDIPGTLDVTGAATFDATVTVAGDLTVNGTTTTISTQNLLVEDKNIIIGDVASPTDVTADGGGITLKGATDKTINWVDATDAWTSSERFSVPLGSAASPSLTFTGDPNTGIYSPGADQVAISTGGSGRLFVDASGLVGVGSTAPDYLLTVGSGSGVSASPTAIRLDNTFTGSPATKDKLKFYLYKDANESYGLTVGDGGDLQYWAGGSSNGIHRWFTSGSERLRITSAGLVGIGTSSPDANSQLHIVGSSYQPLYVNTTGVGGGGATFFRSGTQALYVGTAGSSWLSGSSTADGLVRAEANLVLSTNGNSRAVTIDTSQRVGIGTTSPRQALTFGSLVSSSTSTPDCIDLGATYTSTSASTNLKFKLYVDSSGNTYGFTVNGSSQLEYYAGTVGSPGNHVFLTGGSERARLDSSGRLLVGTASDSGGALLQVNGDRVRIATAKTPASATDTGTAGEICWDASYVYVCTATNTWKRSALSTW